MTTEALLYSTAVQMIFGYALIVTALLILTLVAFRPRPDKHRKFVISEFLLTKGLFANVKTNCHMGRLEISKHFSQNITETKDRVSRLAFRILQSLDRVKSPVTKPMSINEKNTVGHKVR